MKVLVVTQSEDVGIAAVLEALKRRGAEVFRFDTDRFPTDFRLSVWQGAASGRSILSGADYALDLCTLGAMWFRWVDVGHRLPAMDQEIRAAAVKESSMLLEGMTAEGDVFQLDPISRSRTAASKLYQHRVAVAVGLAIPRTVVTNDPDEVRRFAREMSGGRLVTKLNYGFVREREGGDWYEAATTTPLGDADLDALAGLDLCPMIFQEEIAKRVEIRATVVGQRIFAAEVDSQSVPANRHDWRVDQAANAWRACELPESVAAGLLALLTRLGLNYSACDMILTPDGRYVFLEANTHGKFTWIEEQTGLPISAAIADLLLGHSPRRVRGGGGPPASGDRAGDCTRDGEVNVLCDD
jgi:hypothetical protein